jgi:AcrR family transcriptional regulator
MSTPSEHDQATGPRPYRMRKRAEAVDETRQRIVEAAVALHTSVGPAQTTISALAEHAGVTRVTVYRHYPDEESLLRDCTAHWAALHPGPDVEAWLRIADPRSRARTAIADLYAWYDANGADLIPIFRDIDAMPATSQAEMRAQEGALADVLVTGTSARGRARTRLRAAAAHVTSLWTWRSLTDVAGADAARLATTFFLAALDDQAR